MTRAVGDDVHVSSVDSSGKMTGASGILYPEVLEQIKESVNAQ
jgi:hypothetical protein